MKNKIFVIAVPALAALVGFFACWFLVGGSVAEVSQKASARRAVAKSVVTRSKGKTKEITEIKLDAQKKTVRIVKTEMARPDVLSTVEDDEEAALTEAQRRVLAELQEALDADDLKRVRKALAKFADHSVASAGMSSLPRIMRARAVEALGWFGAKAVVDLVSFTTDSDEGVRSDAMNQVEMALQDNDLSDFERAAVVKATLKYMTDPEQIESIVDQFSNMRNSVKADTAIAVLNNGNEAVQSVMKEQLEFHFDGDVQTVGDIEKWKAMNPDDPDDGEFYGGGDSES